MCRTTPVRKEKIFNSKIRVGNRQDRAITIAVAVHFFLLDQFLALSGLLSQSSAKFLKASWSLSSGRADSPWPSGAVSVFSLRVWTEEAREWVDFVSTLTDMDSKERGLGP